MIAITHVLHQTLVNVLVAGQEMTATQVLYMMIHANDISDLVYMLLLTDIDECEDNIVGCEHNCVNIDGHYSCTCESENALATDLHNCLGKLSNLLAFRGQLKKDTCSQKVQVETSFIDYFMPSILCNTFPHNFTPIHKQIPILFPSVLYLPNKTISPRKYFYSTHYCNECS